MGRQLEFIGLRIDKSLKKSIKSYINNHTTEFGDRKYQNYSHFFRCAAIKLMRDEL